MPDPTEAFTFSATGSAAIVGVVAVPWRWLQTPSTVGVRDVGFYVGNVAWAGYNGFMLPDGDWE